jgi:phosphoglycolate phosphatase
MGTLIAAWGYLGLGEGIEAWGADAIIERPDALLHWLELA